MATLPKITKPMPLGIIHPSLAHRFIIVFNNKPQCMLTLQTTCAELDLVQNTLAIEVEQPIVGGDEIVQDLRSMASSKYGATFELQLIDGDDQVSDSFAGNCSMKSHKLRYDYAISAAATHKIIFNITLNP